MYLLCVPFLPPATPAAVFLFHRAPHAAAAGLILAMGVLGLRQGPRARAAERLLAELNPVRATTISQDLPGRLPSAQLRKGPRIHLGCYGSRATYLGKRVAMG